MVYFLSYYTMLDGQVDTEEMSKCANYTGISKPFTLCKIYPGANWPHYLRPPL